MATATAPVPNLEKKPEPAKRKPYIGARVWYWRFSPGRYDRPCVADVLVVNDDGTVGLHYHEPGCAPQWRDRCRYTEATTAAMDCWSWNPHEQAKS